MKKKVLLSLTIISTTFLSGCSFSATSIIGTITGQKSNNEHTHSYSDKWSYDSTHHWHDPACSDITDVKDYAEHTFSEEIIVEKNNTRYHSKTCLVCGYTNEIEVVYTVDRDEYNLAINFSNLNFKCDYYDKDNKLVESYQNKNGELIRVTYDDNSNITNGEYWLLSNDDKTYYKHETENQVGTLEDTIEDTILGDKYLGKFSKLEFSNIYNEDKRYYEFEIEDSDEIDKITYAFADKSLETINVIYKDESKITYKFDYTNLNLQKADYVNRCIHDHSKTSSNNEEKTRYICDICHYPFYA